MLAEHLAAERPEQTAGRGRTCSEWTIRPGGGENHGLDLIVGCCVAAAIEGAALPDSGGAAAHAVKRKIKLSDLQKMKRRF
jgi:hypothetical protein